MHWRVSTETNCELDMIEFAMHSIQIARWNNMTIAWHFIFFVYHWSVANFGYSPNKYFFAFVDYFMKLYINWSWVIWRDTCCIFTGWKFETSNKIREKTQLSIFSNTSSRKIPQSLVAATLVIHIMLSLLNHYSYVIMSAMTSQITGLCEGNSPVTGEFPSQRASNADNVSHWWRHHVIRCPDISITKSSAKF